MAKEFWLRLLMSLNPNAYEELAQERLRSTIVRFFTVVGIFTLILFLTVPVAILLKAGILAERLAGFEQATLGANVSAEGEVVLLDRPRVTFAEEATEPSGQLTFTLNEVWYKPFYWFGSGSVAYSEFNDLTTIDPLLLFIVGLAFWPTIAFWGAVYVLLKALIAIPLAALVGWLVIGTFKQRLTFKSSLKAACYASTFLLIEMLVLPFFWAWWLFLGLFVLAFLLGVALMSDRKQRSHYGDGGGH